MFDTLVELKRRLFLGVREAVGPILCTRPNLRYTQRPMENLAAGDRRVCQDTP